MKPGSQSLTYTGFLLNYMFKYRIRTEEKKSKNLDSMPLPPPHLCWNFKNSKKFLKKDGQNCLLKNSKWRDTWVWFY